MQRIQGMRLIVIAAVAAMLAGACGRASLGAGHGADAVGSCTQGSAACTDAGVGSGYVAHGSGGPGRYGAGAYRHGRVACGPRGCGPRACGPGACGHPAGCRGPHGCGHCCRGGGCHHGGCGAGWCDACGHWLHHDVYEKRYFLRSQGKSWHSTWYDPSEGRPIALVVPPTAEFQTQYGWGVPSSRVAPIYHQFRRPYPGPGAVGGSGGGFLPTPNQPSDTVQFGVNAVRGPWGSY